MKPWTFALLAALASPSLPAAAAKVMTNPDAPLRALVADQASGLTGDTAYFLGTFAADAVVFFPAGVAVGEDMIQQSTEEAFIARQDAPSKSKLGKLKIGRIAADAAWLTFDLELRGDEGGGTTTWSLRVTELATRDQDGTWTVRAAHFSQAFADKEAIRRAKAAADFPAVLGGGDGNGALDFTHALTTELGGPGAWLDRPAQWPLATGLRPVTLIGSTAKELGIGAGPVGKLLKAWKKLTLEVVGPARHAVDKNDHWAFLAANVTVGITGKDKVVVKVPYRLLLVLENDAAKGWRVVSAHFSSQL